MKNDKRKKIQFETEYGKRKIERKSINQSIDDWSVSKEMQMYGNCNGFQWAGFCNSFLNDILTGRI